MMKSYTLSIGIRFSVPVAEVDVIRSTDSAPIKRQIAAMRKAGLLQDATGGKKTRSLVVLKSGRMIISPIQQETLESRYNEASK